jgi:hypothetical protein
MMLDDLKAGWDSEMKKPVKHEQLATVLEILQRETCKLDKSIKRRDILEVSIALLLIPVWSWKLVYSVSLMQSVGLWVAILACLFIPYKLIKAKKVNVQKNDSILSFLLIEKVKLENQKKLLESVALWYILPLMVAIILITAGATVDSLGIPQLTLQLKIYYSFCALLSVGVYLLNKRAAKKRFKPLLDKVNHRIKEIK